MKPVIVAAALALVATPASAGIFPDPTQTPEITIPGCNVYLHPETGNPCDSPFYMSIDLSKPNAYERALEGLTFEGQVVSMVPVPYYSIDFEFTVQGDLGPAKWTCRATTTHLCLTGLIKLPHPFRPGSL